MHDFFEDEKRYYMVTEICEGGELFDEIQKRSRFSERDAAVVMKQILSCLNYCHSQNIVHRDLKPEYILIDTDNKEFDNLKIIDFSKATVFDPTKNLKEKLGSPYYIAPEVLNKIYDQKCDIWSCGVLTYILLSGTPPFNGTTNAEIYQRIREGQFNFDSYEWDGISVNAKSFISDLLTYYADERPSAQEAVQHPWIVELSQQEVEETMAMGALHNMTEFDTSNFTLKQATYAFIASQLLTKKERDDLAKVFKSFDKNNDGKLSIEEVKDGYREHYGRDMTGLELQSMFNAVDTDHSGFIDYSEFVVAAMHQNQLTTDEKMHAAFNMFDKDGSGIIHPEEIREVLQFGGTT